MTALALFAATFVLVFALGVQQLNVTADWYAGAFFTSLVISTANLMLFKVLPGPTSAWDVIGYSLGGAFGIVAAMRAHPIIVRRWHRMGRRAR